MGTFEHLHRRSLPKSKGKRVITRFLQGWELALHFHFPSFFHTKNCNSLPYVSKIDDLSYDIVMKLFGSKQNLPGKPVF